MTAIRRPLHYLSMHRVGKVAAAAAAAIGVFVSSLAIAAERPLPLSARVLRSGELVGFVPQRPVLYKSAQKLVNSARAILTPTQAAAWKANLRRDGFKASLQEDLKPATGSDRAALSSVTQFRSAAAAKAEVGVTARWPGTVHRKPGWTYASFKVDKIPGARGFHDTRPGFWGDNIVFSDGPFVYLVGNGWVTRRDEPASARRLACRRDEALQAGTRPPAHVGRKDSGLHQDPPSG